MCDGVRGVVGILVLEVWVSDRGCVVWNIGCVGGGFMGCVGCCFSVGFGF